MPTFGEYFIFYAITVVLISPLCPPPPARPHSHSPSPHRCPCPWVLHSCSLSSSFTFFQPAPAAPLPAHLFRGLAIAHTEYPVQYWIHCKGSVNDHHSILYCNRFVNRIVFFTSFKLSFPCKKGLYILLSCLSFWPQHLVKCLAHTSVQ